MPMNIELQPPWPMLVTLFPSVTHTDQIIRKLLDCGSCGTGLNRFRIVRYQNGLCGFDNQDAFLALQIIAS